MPPPLSETFWGPFRQPLGLQNGYYCGWTPRSMDLGHDMDKWKDFALTGKKIMVVGGAVPTPLSHSVLTQIMQQGDEAWVDMSPRKLHVFHALNHFMGGTMAATLFQFGDVDHFETFFEGAEGRDVTGDVHQVSLDDLSKHAEAITSQRIFQSTDVLVINHDFLFMIANDTTFDNFTNYIIGRVDRAMAAMDALVKAALPRMKKGGRIIVLTNSLWTLAATEASSRGDESLIGRSQALGIRAQEVMEEYGIELCFLLNRILPDIRPLNWDSLRNTINGYAFNGYSVDMLRNIGSRVAAIAAGGMKYRNKEDESIIYDNVLAKLLHTPCHWSHDWNIDRDEITHSAVLNSSFTDRYIANLASDPPLPKISWRFVPPEAYVDRIRGRVQEEVPQPDDSISSDLKERLDNIDIWIKETVMKEVPLAGKVALVLDSGRSDGITEGVCLELARLGASVALTYVGEGENRAKANELVEKVRLAGGQAVALEGVPYRSVAYTDKNGTQDNYIGDLVYQALHAFGAGKIHVIVNNVGYGGDRLARNVYEWRNVKYEDVLIADSIRERKKLVQADNIRNILAMHYVVEACAEFGILGDGGRIINIAGIGTAPSTAVDGRPFWEHHCRFMDFWQLTINLPTKSAEERVAINTIVTCDGGEQVLPLRMEGRETFVWMKSVERYFATRRTPQQANDTATVVGWLARPTSKVDTKMITPDKILFRRQRPSRN